ncbi:Panacea domain-containing protein [Cupriavidus agavae]|uniref:Uncharacterized protein DUF4065 n=1 Tax=Cupriavidus agavae TaxID=1001822 RepID=A0A4Q7RF01_9BURK|nr:Panacea domain-containing protein [Cupriavidus agavae]RZT31795.1 uncharacterized protein DUF4065 [Cupriavidus agavae]
MFDETKLAQAAAYLVDKRNGRMSHLKLIKLLYLADREALRRYESPITGDNYVAMSHGPVLSRTLDLMNGFVPPNAEGWAGWLSDVQNYEVTTIRPVYREVLDHLSDAEIGVLHDTFERYGHMTRWELRDLTHDPKQIPEWHDPKGTSRPIHLGRVLEAVGKPPALAQRIREELEARQNLDDLFARL